MLLIMRAAMTAFTIDTLQIPQTNIVILQSLFGKAAQKVLDEVTIGKDTIIDLTVQTSDDRWIVQQAISSTLLDAGYRVQTESPLSEDTTVRFDVKPIEIRVAYDGILRSGLFGTKRTIRTLSCSLAFLITETQTHNVRLSKTLSVENTDTVDVDLIPHLEDQSVKSTQGKIPDESFIDRIAEPLVIIGAAGTIIYLFFHIRS